MEKKINIDIKLYFISCDGKAEFSADIIPVSHDPSETDSKMLIDITHMIAYMLSLHVSVLRVTKLQQF